MIAVGEASEQFDYPIKDEDIERTGCGCHRTSGARCHARDDRKRRAGRRRVA